MRSRRIALLFPIEFHSLWPVYGSDDDDDDEDEDEDGDLDYED